MNEKGLLYYALMGILSALCIAGIITFIKNKGNNYWWRWIYIFGGSYVLFDLFAIVTKIKIWQKLLKKMFDTTASYWFVLWGGFSLIGMLVLILGISIFREMCRQNKYNG